MSTRRGAPLAGLVLPVVATAVAARYDWRAGVAVGGMVAAGALLLVVGVVGETPPTAPDLDLRRRLHPRSVLARFARPGVAFTTVLAILGMYTLQSFISFFPAFLQEYHGFTQGQASFAFAAAFAVVVVGLPLVGSIAVTPNASSFQHANLITVAHAGPNLTTSAILPTVCPVFEKM